MQEKKNILIAPLDWGLGHASRCIPIIQYLLDCNCNIFLASSGKALELLKLEFPQLPLFNVPSYNVKYSVGNNMILSMLIQSPKVLLAIRHEYKWLQQFLKKYKIDAVISDNRYGMWSRKISSVLITHQLNIQSPVASKLLQYLVFSYANKFDEVWIPDSNEENNLSGKLSHFNRKNKKVKYIGILSRFAEMKAEEILKRFDICVILSGPEPQRSIFEKIVLNQLIEFPELKCAVLRGLENSQIDIPIHQRISMFSHLSKQKFLNLIYSSDVVISRSGYTTIMDIACTGSKAVFIPTPGQTEQEYLAKYHKENRNYFSVLQHEFDLSLILKEYNNYSGIYLKSRNMFMQKIDEWLKTI